MTLEDIAIGFVSQLGPRGVAHLCDVFGSAQQVYAASAAEIVERSGLRADIAARIAAREGLREAERELRHCERYGIEPIAAGDELYPSALYMAQDAPHVIYTMGRPDALTARHMLSVVGTRKMTPYGELICTRVIERLAEMFPDLVVISGLAFGIDAAAHRAAVQFGLRTIGVTATALPDITPSQHTALAGDMLAHGGMVITELHSQTKQNGNLYIPRNRIIAAMGEGLLLVESPREGGAMSTVAAADGYGRVVMATPGRATDPMSAGPNHIIRTGLATLVTSGEAVADALGWQSEEAPREWRAPSAEYEANDDEARVLACFEGVQDGIFIERLAERASMPIQQVSAILLNLELAGVVRQLPGKIFEKL